MLCRTCWLQTKSYRIQYESKNSLSGVILEFFSQKISEKSVRNPLKNFTVTLWLRKSGTKASGPQVCWQTIAGHWRKMYLTPHTGENHTRLHFRGTFQPVSWAREVLFAHFNSSVSLKHCLIEKLCIRTWIQHESAAKFIYWSSWHKKKVKFCWPV